MRPSCSPAHSACLWFSLCLALLGGVSLAQEPQSIVQAEFAEPTDRYDHAILGDAMEWGALRLTVEGGATRILRLPQTRVFEDLTPRLVDLDADGMAEVIVVETDMTRGARLSVYGADGLRAATPYIGHTHRWLAPVGAADFDGDGQMEIAYVDRPHLAKTLRVWRFAGGELSEIAAIDGLTNHRIGWAEIPGGIRDCDGPPEIITANANWTRIMATRLERGVLVPRDIGAYTRPSSLTRAAETCGR
ncbi:FG-GAP repeat domain-containing protein [Poseidonocella pacifica]|nr:VCBS repeat-containing protein [Poseidonocella pacifica]